MTITQNAFVMVFGALIASAGLVLLYQRSERGENKIKLFGQEFQLSTPALVVFLAGCAVFVTPLVIHTENQTIISIDLSGRKGSINDASTVITTEEREPNDQLTAANLIKLGTTIKGSILTEQDRDFFKFKTSGRGLNTRVILRKTSTGGFSAEVTIYNAVEARITSRTATGEDAVSFAFQSNPDSYYYAKVGPFSSTLGDRRGPYELLIKEE